MSTPAKVAAKIATEAAPNQFMTAVPAAKDGIYGVEGGENAEKVKTRQVAEQFPTKFLGEAEKKDVIMNLRADIGERYGRQHFTDEDAKWLLRKIEAAKEADFDAWFARTIDMKSPAQKEIARQLYPKYFANRVATMQNNLRTLEALAKIRINGVQSARDLALQYAADRGFLPMGQLKNILHPEINATEAKDAAGAFRRGLFSVGTTFAPETSRSQEYNRSMYAGMDTDAPVQFSGIARATTNEAAYNILQKRLGKQPMDVAE